MSAAKSSSNPAAAPKSRLGRGLSSLIKVSIPEPAPVAVDTKGAKPVDPAAGRAKGGSVQVEAAAPAVVEKLVEKIVDRVVEVDSGRPVMVPVEIIKPNPHQPRRTFTEIQLKELAESIKTNGVIQPLVVRKLTGVGAAGGYELIAGERRLRASKLAGLSEVPCHIKEVDGLTQAQMALVENIQREDLNPLERAEGYKTLMTQLGLTQAELAGRMGEDRSTIANYLRLLDLAEPVRRMLREGKISLGHAKLLAGVNDVLEQERLAKLVLLQGLSVRNLEKLMMNPPAAGAESASEKTAAMGKEAHYQELEKSIARSLGLRVQLRAGRAKGKGKLTIHYGTLDQFDKLMELLGVETE